MNTPPFTWYSPPLTLIGEGALMPLTVIGSETTKIPLLWAVLGANENALGVVSGTLYDLSSRVCIKPSESLVVSRITPTPDASQESTLREKVPIVSS